MARNQVTVTFAGDAKQLSKTFSKITADGDKMDRSLAGASERIGAGFAGLAKKAALVGTALAAVGAAGAVALGKGLLSAAEDASDLNEAMSKVDAIFDDRWAGYFNAFGDAAATSIGLSKKEALDAAGSFGNLFQQLGFGQEQMVSMSSDIIRLGADFGSFHNADITDVLDAQSAAFRGEYDSLQRFLPLINAAAVEQRALALTGKENKDALTAQDKALAVYKLMLEGAGEAQGDFQRTADGMANSTRTAEAHMANLRAEIGQKMVPVAQALTKIKLKLAKAIADRLGPAIDTVGAWFQEHRGTFESIGATITTVVLPAVGDLVYDIGTALYDAVAWLIEHKQTWIDIGSAIMNVAVPAFTTIAGWIQTVAANKDALISIGIGVAAVLVPAFTAWAVGAAAAAAATLLAMAPLVLIGAAVAGVAYLIISNWDTIKEKTSAFWGWLTSTASSTWDTISGGVTSAWDTITGAIGDAVDSVESTFTAFKTTVGDIWDAIGDAISGPIETAVAAVKRVWNNTVGGKGISIPSIPGIFDGASFTIPKMADGGIVTRPTLALIGEGRESEAVVPLSKLGQMTGAGQNGPVQLTINSGGTRMDDVLVDVLRRAISVRGGDPVAVLAA